MRYRVAALVCWLAWPLLADEGLWLFNQFPREQVRKQYNVDVSDAFLLNLRLATLRIGDGSGALVSPGGLLVTTRHIVSPCLAQAGSPTHDDPGAAFYVPTRREELACPGLEAAALLAIEDVTTQVKDAARPGARPAEALALRNAAMAHLERACVEKTGNACSVVKLFSGERYDLYCYKTYTDLRLVFAPELAIAAFGGNPASHTYPRYSLDTAFLRAYENGRPADTPHYLKWSAEGVKDGDLVFAAGNPGPTSRAATAAQLTFYRDVELPYAACRFQSRIQDLLAFAARGAGNQRLAQPAMAGLAGGYKLAAGKLIGLRDDWLMLRKQSFEKRLRAAVEHDPKLGAASGKVWDEVTSAYKTWTPFEKPYQVLERPAAEPSELFRVARSILRLSEERAKPSEQRLPDYRDSALPSLETALYSPVPIQDSIEIELLTRYLEDLKTLGEKEVPLKALLAARTPRQAAEEMVHSTKLKDVAERRRLAASRDALAESEDGFIRLARLLEEPARKLLKKHQDTIESLETSAAERIAQYRYRVFGAADYPEGTSTPRVTFGAVKAYRGRAGAPVPFATTFSGLYYLAVGQTPGDISQRWRNGKDLLDPVMPFDFVSTCDITSGASGAPVVNARGEIVGLTFDGNLESLAITYLYDDDQARAVHVASQAIVAALEKIYKAAALVRELIGYDIRATGALQ